MYGCKSAGFHQHYGQDNTLRNNIFALSHEYEMMFLTRPESRNSFTLERNVIYFDRGYLFGASWSQGQFRSQDDLYFDRRDPNILFAGKTFSERKAAGRDSDSDITDPLFASADNFDFRLQRNSPALSRRGFQQIDMSTVGPKENPLAQIPGESRIVAEHYFAEHHFHPSRLQLWARTRFMRAPNKRTRPECKAASFEAVLTCRRDF